MQEGRGRRDRRESLRSANLWNEVKDRLNKPGMGLSGGQQQRLCIARAIAVEPQVLLMDEPCSALDPISTSAIEDLIHELKTEYTIVIVTHNMQQAARVSDETGFFNLKAAGQPGHLIEFNATKKMFSNPDERRHRGLHLRPLRLTATLVEEVAKQPSRGPVAGRRLSHRVSTRSCDLVPRSRRWERPGTSPRSALVPRTQVLVSGQDEVEAP